MTRRGIGGLFASIGLAISLMPALPTGTKAHPPESTEANERIVNGDDLFLTAQNGWHIYVNGRFGTRISYPPDLFTPAEAPEAGDGRRFEGEHAVIEVIGWENENGLTPRSLSSHLNGAEGYDDIFLKDTDEARLVLSGYRAARVFYEEYVFQSDTVQAFAMEYPSELRSTYDPLLQAIAASFVHGDEAGSGELAAGPHQGDCPSGLGCAPPADLASPSEPPAQLHAHGADPPAQARPPTSGELRILVWGQNGPGGKKLKMKSPAAKRLKALSGKGPPVARGIGGKKAKVKKPGRKKPKGKGQGRGKKR